MMARSLRQHIRANPNVRTSTAEAMRGLLEELDEIAAEEIAEEEAERKLRGAHARADRQLQRDRKEAR